MKKLTGITLADLIERLMDYDDNIKGKEIESMGCDSRDNLVIRFTDATQIRILRTKERSSK